MERTYRLPIYSLAAIIIAIVLPGLALIYTYTGGCPDYWHSTSCGTFNALLAFFTPWVIAYISAPIILIGAVMNLVSFIWRKKKGLYVSKLHRVMSLLITIALVVAVILILILLAGGEFFLRNFFLIDRLF
jgi:hypothetical protein